MMFKSREENALYRCCFCCHVRAGTIILGLFHLVVQVLVMCLLAVAMIHPEVLNTRNASSYVQQDGIIVENGGYHIEHLTFKQKYSKDNMFVALAISSLMLTFILMLIFGAAKSRPGYLMPFFCVQVFEFCVLCLSAVGYFSYMPNFKLWLQHQLPEGCSFRETVLGMDNEWLMLTVVLALILFLSLKAYLIGVVWSCYKYLQSRSSETHMHDYDMEQDTEMLLPPKYDDVVQMPTERPPPYTAM